VLIGACAALAVFGPWSIVVRATAVATVLIATAILFGRKIEIDSQQLSVSSLLGPTLWSVSIRDIRMVRRDKPEPFLRYILSGDTGVDDLAQNSPFVMVYLRDGPTRRITASDPQALVAALKPLLWQGDAEARRLAEGWESTLLDE